VTRDRIYSEGEWLGNYFTVIDTGGLEPNNEEIMMSNIKKQAEVAIDTADVILFVVDGKEGLTDVDKEIGNILRKSGKRVVLGCNKIDNINKMDFDNIDLKIKENIEKPKFKSGSGNGLLTCRLKTKNQLYLELLDAKNENKYKFILRLKLDYYEKSNPGTSKNTFS
ncbi:MAG: hypothetical protein GX793_06430, partial [Bacteroidales bacterium]|nr:hypothetical protein [Bacteroidales bacterium]